MQLPYRRNRAMTLTAAIINHIADRLERTGDEYLLRDVQRMIFELLYAKGVEVITDADRVNAGLSPRNEDGITIEELLAIEKSRLDAIMQPAPPIMVYTPVIKDG